MLEIRGAHGIDTPNLAPSHHLHSLNAHVEVKKRLAIYRRSGSVHLKMLLKDRH